MGFKKNIKNFIQDAFQKCGFKISNLYNINFLESIMYQLLKKKKQIKFIQIGANDGKRFDPIHEFVKYNKDDVEGYVVEPINDYYNDLCKTYKAYPMIKPINVAIHKELKETVIYRVAKKFEDKVPEFALGIASLDKEHHKKTNIPTEFIIEERVSCMTLRSLLVEYSINELDVLILDTEGYDYEILMNVNFNEISPSIIHFEHGLKPGTMSINQFKDVIKRLKKMDYQLFVDEADVTAYKTDIIFNASLTQTN